MPGAPADMRFTLDGIKLGARLVLPLTPGITIFAAAFGTAAAHKGVTLAEAVLSSMLVFAGASQFVSLELWTRNWTFAAILAISIVTFTVNARMILQGASLQPWLAPVPGKLLWPSMFLFTDATWVVAERYRADGGDDRGVILGAGLVLWSVWVLATIPGVLVGGLIEDAHRWGIDLVLPLFFVAMAVPLWKGRRDTIAWTVAGIVSVAMWWLVPGYSYIVVGALAGALAGALLGMRDDG